MGKKQNKTQNELDHLLEASEGKLHRSLKNRHIQLIAISGAIGTGLFMGSSKSINIAGPSIILVYLVIGIALYFVMRAMGELLLSNLEYATFADFAEDLLGPWAGFLTGWSYWIAWVITGMADVVAIVGYIKYWWKDLPNWIPALVVILTLFLLNSLTVKAFGETEFWFSLIKIIAIIALIIGGTVLVIIHYKHQATITNLWNDGGFFPMGFTGFLAGFQIAIFAFQGIELVGTTAAETHDPEKNLPKAINSIPVRVILFYCLSLAVIMSVTPWRMVKPGESPFVTMFGLIGLAAAASIVNVVVITSGTSSCNSGIYSTSRMMYGLGLRGDSFPFFKKLSKHGVPLRALALSCILLLGSILFLELGDSIIGAFTLITSVSAVMFMMVWSLILISWLVYRFRFPQRHAASKYKLPGGVAAAVGGLIFMVFAFVALSLKEDTRNGLIALVVWCILMAFGYFVLGKFSPEIKRRRAEHKAKIEAIKAAASN